MPCTSPILPPAGRSRKVSAVESGTIEPTPARPDGRQLVQVRLMLPREVADWLKVKAGRRYKPRSAYVRDLLVGLYQKENGEQ